MWRLAWNGKGLVLKKLNHDFIYKGRGMRCALDGWRSPEPGNCPGKLGILHKERKLLAVSASLTIMNYAVKEAYQEIINCEEPKFARHHALLHRVLTHRLIL